MYAQVVEDEAAARELVREHAEAGYDHIKAHDALDSAAYRAVLDEAARIGIGVVGHVPHGLTVADAVHGGLETIEEEVRRLRAAGYVFPDHQLTEFREALASLDLLD